MKKMLMGIFAMLLVLTMGTTVFAAPSPGPETAIERQARELNENLKNVAAKGTNNTLFNVTPKKVDATKVTKANEVANSISSSAKLLAMSDLSVDKNVDTSKGITVTLSIDPTLISSGYTVYVLHQYGDGKWEVVKPSSVANGQVTVTLYSLSPVAIVQYPTNVSVPTSDPSKNKPDSSNNTNNNTNSSESSNNTNSHNTSGPSQSNSNSSNSSNSNNQSNSQTNNQNNPVNVKQNVTVNYPDRDSDSYDNGYSDGYSDGRNSVKGTSASSNGVAASGGTTSAGVLSPKTGASLPALPIVAVFALAGIVVCSKKAHANR